MGFLTRCKRPFLFAFLLQFCNMLFSFFLKTFLILFEKQQMFTVTKDRYVSYTIARILDTGVGVLAGLAINRLFPAPRDARDTEDAEAMREDASSHARRAKKTHPARRHWGGFSGKGRASY